MGQRWAIVLRLVGAAALSAPMARAQPATTSADAQFDFGLAEMQAGRYTSGCPALEVSYRLDPRPGVLFTLAECETRWAKLASALLHYEAYLDVFQKLPAAERLAQRERQKLALARKASLGSEVPHLTITLAPSAPAETVVARDGTVLTPSMLGASLPVELGEHVVTATAADGRKQERRVTLWKSQSDTVVIDLPSAPASPPLPSSTETAPPVPPPVAPGYAVSEGGTRTAAYVVGAVGAVGLVVGGVTGGLAIGQKATVNDRCPTPSTCNQAGLDAVNTGRALGWTSTVAFGVGGAGLVTALVLFLVHPVPRSGLAWQPTVWTVAGATGGGVRGTW